MFIAVVLRYQSKYWSAEYGVICRRGKQEMGSQFVSIFVWFFFL